ncbi:DUF2252 domain-containing protein [Vulcanococcus limneticus]|uniref:DUF2252 domain-containing protein n=1 Tax=Vulcanococcus limneticus TaxID=2170428 RepID=UPI00398C1056
MDTTDGRLIRADSQARFRPRAERLAAGKGLRQTVPRKAHATWRPAPDRPDPIATLEESSAGRLPSLIPIRYGRMMRSPFTFLRGSAALMASDLATTATTNVQVQACGDCHVLNFGLFATPERNLVFDLNDFDETHPAPFEWDLKRLTASLVVAARDSRMTDQEAEAAVLACVHSYRTKLREYSHLSPLDVWYERLDARDLIAMAPDEKSRKFREKLALKARKRVIDHLFPKIVSQVGGTHRFVDMPPVLFHVDDPDLDQRVKAALEDYRQSLSHERQVLFDRYRLEDVAIKVVGIGSVATRCWVALFFSEDNHPMILQIKEARRSVLEPFTQPSAYDNQGQRVVVGQRLMQSSSDIMLGWVRSINGVDLFIRQLRDMKLSVPLEGLTAIQLERYADVCAWTLARAHAKSGDAAMISGYLGKSDTFDRALADFAGAYADQTERDHRCLVEAVQSGRLEALVEEAL